MGVRYRVVTNRNAPITKAKRKNMKGRKKRTPRLTLFDALASRVAILVTWLPWRSPASFGPVKNILNVDPMVSTEVMDKLYSFHLQ